MRKNIYILSGVIGLLIATPVSAQLPANPWAVQPQVTAEATTASTSTSAGADIGHIKAAPSQRAYIPSIKYNPPTENNTSAQPYSSASFAVNRSASSNSYAVPRSNSAYALQPNNSSNSGNWRGSGQFGKLGYTGEVTTYGHAQGQQMLAPEVNNQNMNIMVQHLRNLGYKIPSSYDNGFSNFLQNYSADLRTAYSGLGRQHNPIDGMFSSIVGAFESFTGLDTGNLMFNSLDLIQRK